MNLAEDSHFITVALPDILSNVVQHVRELCGHPDRTVSRHASAAASGDLSVTDERHLLG